MMHRLIFITALILVGAFVNARAQEQTGQSEYFDQLIETLLEELEEDAEVETWLEELERLFENPLELNHASRDELLRIPFLTEAHAEAILAYRKLYGSFYSNYELASIAGIGRSLAEKISLFVIPGTVSERTANTGRLMQQLIVRGWQSFPKPAGYLPRGDKEPAYTGSPLKLYTQYRLQAGSKIEAGITADKDPGEPFLSPPNVRGFDFYSGFVQMPLSRRIPQFIVGDFAVQAGQGLIVWQGFGMGKSAEVLQLSKGMTRIRPYTSSDENRFFRGLAQRIELGTGRIHLFLSHKRSDGNLVFNSDSTLIFTSLQTSGYHRTLSEIADKNSVSHSVAGAIFTHSYNNLRWGATLLGERFEFPFVRGPQLYQKYLFTGQNNLNAGIHYRWSKGRLQLYGESAISKSGGAALIQGMEGRLHDQLILAIVYRHYDIQYHTTWGRGFGEGSNTANESGLYLGLKAYPFAGIVLSGYADWFSSRWINYTTIGPMRGNDFLLQGDFWSRNKLSGFLRVKYKAKPTKTKADNHYYDQLSERTQIRMQVKYQPFEQFYLRSRLDRVWANNERGVLIFQDVYFNFTQSAITLNLRGAWFSTDSYNTRISMFENDLLYNFSSPAFYGKGIRGYINTRYRLTQSLDVWMKAAKTIYSDRETIGSGHGMSEGNTKTEVKIQIRYRF